jgi:hypothetical protein
MVPTLTVDCDFSRRLMGNVQTRKLNALLDASSDGKATSSNVLAPRGGIGLITDNVLADGIQNGIVSQLESSLVLSTSQGVSSSRLEKSGLKMVVLKNCLICVGRTAQVIVGL